MKYKISVIFLVIALLALIMGIMLGLLAALQYVIPEFIKDIIPFNKLRPFHVTTVISWIILCATGSIYFFLTQVEKLKIYSTTLPVIHLIVFLGAGVGVYISFLTGKMEGREYLAFTPWLTLPILIGWFIFGINYFKTTLNQVKNWPVYYWMWGTGIIFMMYHLCEAYFWLFPSVRSYFIKDISIQWKSYGSFVGSWNMLIYGIAIYLMSKIKNTVSIAFGKKTFFFYFLGLSNLMFGWAHHTYIIPMQPWIRYAAYAISMTEWVLLIHIIYNWKNSLSPKTKEEFSLVYKFLITADIWVFINLILALLISIPAINYFTHGSHITVAHSMGTTIGINTSILFAALFFVTSQLKVNFKGITAYIKRSCLLYNSILFLFWITLIIIGVKRNYWTYFQKDMSFTEMHDSTYYLYLTFFIFGVFLVLALLLIISPLLKTLIQSLSNTTRVDT